MGVLTSLKVITIMKEYSKKVKRFLSLNADCKNNRCSRVIVRVYCCDSIWICRYALSVWNTLLRYWGDDTQSGCDDVVSLNCTWYYVSISLMLSTLAKFSYNFQNSWRIYELRHCLGFRVQTNCTNCKIWVNRNCYFEKMHSNAFICTNLACFVIIYYSIDGSV